MAPKGCAPVVIGDDCPDEKPCTVGTAGSEPVSSAGSAGKPTGSGGAAGGKPTGSAGAAGGGKICGGLIAIDAVNPGCPADEYCAFDIKTACGSFDQTGICAPKPQVCPDIYAPVCGCDGKTYSSDCSAAANGTSVLHTGVCQEPASGISCGGLKPVACPKSEYCDYPIGTQCGVADQTGTCMRIPDACDAVYDPVCGCDNATYSSACAAALNGISVLHDGACEGSVCGGLTGVGCPKGANCVYPIEANCGASDQTGTCMAVSDTPCPKNLEPVCSCTGKTYDNTCLAHAAAASVATMGACTAPGTVCGGKLGAQCAGNQYCDYPISANCGRADATGTCVAKVLGACTTEYDPVCGCDGKTYGNPCDAGLFGVAISSKGECP